MKQTAVERLIEQLKERGYAGEFPPYLLFEQSKTMEKEQIEDAYIMGSYDMASKEFNPSKYYEEIYKK